MFHIRIKVSTTHNIMLVYLFFHTYLSNSYIGFFFKIELNAPLAISNIFTISSSHFPFVFYI